MSKTYIGDWLASLFSKLGFKTKPGCGCQARKEYLNKIHQRAENAIIRRRTK